jgi:uncharacterized membrane protein
MIYAILIIIFAVVFFVKMSDVNGRIDQLKSEINKLKQQIGSGQSSGQSAVAGAGAVVGSQTHTQSHLVQSSDLSPAKPLNKEPLHQQNEHSNEPGQGDIFLAWLKENWLLKIGVLMILVGFGWFVSYAFMHDWIGPVGRIAIGIIAGALIAVFGTMRLGKNLTQGILFSVLGSALVIISILSGQYFYEFFTPMMALGLIFIVSFYVSLTALAYSTEKLAIYGLVISLLAPLISHVAFDLDPVAMYLYLLIISIATVWVSIAKGWRAGLPIGITGILFYSLPVIMSSHGGGIFTGDSTKYSTLAIAYVISFLYLFISAWSLIQKDTIEKTKSGKSAGATSNDVFLTVVSTIMILGFTMSLVPTIFQSLVLALWMIAFAISGFVVFQTTKNEKLFYIHSLVAILFLAIATSVELSGKTLTVAFAIEVAIISIASFLVTNRINIAKAFGVLMVVPMMMSLESIGSSKWSYEYGAGIFHADFAILLLMAVLLGVLGFFYRANKQLNIDGTAERGFGFHHLAIIISTAYLFIIIWLSSHSVMANQDSAVLLSLFVYTVAGLGTYFVGLFNGYHVLKGYGTVMLALVVLRLILVDVWQMELALRVVTFIVLGVMFISTAFISKKQKDEHPEVGAGGAGGHGGINNSVSGN